MYTVPGQVRYASTRKLVLKETDGIIFVADSLEVRREKNMSSMKDLQQYLKEYNASIFKIPLVMQFNKRDLTDDNISLMSLETMQQDLNRQLKAPAIPSSALKGKGVGKTLNACLKLLLKSLQKDMNPSG